MSWAVRGDSAQLSGRRRLQRTRAGPRSLSVRAWKLRYVSDVQPFLSHGTANRGWCEKYTDGIGEADGHAPTRPGGCTGALAFQPASPVPRPAAVDRGSAVPRPATGRQGQLFTEGHGWAWQAPPGGAAARGEEPGGRALLRACVQSQRPVAGGAPAGRGRGPGRPRFPALGSLVLHTRGFYKSEVRPSLSRPHLPAVVRSPSPAGAPSSVLKIKAVPFSSFLVRLYTYTFVRFLFWRKEVNVQVF